MCTKGDRLVGLCCACLFLVWIRSVTSLSVEPFSRLASLSRAPCRPCKKPICAWNAQDSSATDNYPNNDEKQGNEETEYKSVSDYMGGWHAGKFDFDTRICGVTALNYEKSVIFQDNTAASLGPRIAPLESSQENNSNQSPPQWSRRPVDYRNLSQSKIHHCNASPSSQGSVAQVYNEEISWEPFSATIENENGQVCSEWTVTPSNGMLAPRGGRESYADMCTFCVASSPSSSPSLLDFNDKYYLVVRTELDAWAWRLIDTN